MSPLPTEVVAALLGAVVGGLIAFLPALHILRRQERYKAFADLVATFSVDLRLLQFTHPDQSPEYKRTVDILRERYATHHDAVLRASYVLSSSKSEALMRQFRQLTGYDSSRRFPTFTDYEVAYDQEKEVVVRSTASERIRALLEVVRVR